MIRAIKTYIPPGQPAPLSAFLVSLDEKLRRKLLRQIFQLSQIPLCDLKEPHYKHFVLEKYSQFYELREKARSSSELFYDSGRGYYFAHAFHQAAAPGHHEGVGAFPQDTCKYPGVPGVCGKF